MPKNETIPPHPLVVDSETKLCRYATQDDIRRWESMEMRYRSLLAAMKYALGDQPDAE